MPSPLSSPPTPLRVAVLQLDVRDGDAGANLDRLRVELDRTGEADLVVLPELWTSGYAHDEWVRIASTETPRIMDAIGEMARERGAWIAGSMIHGEGDRLFNRLSFVGPDGTDPVHYDKVHLFEPLGEVDRLTAGEARAGADIAGWRAAPSICFDLRFPEMYRLDTLDGAVLFVVVSAWPAVRREAYRILCRARALENQAFLVFCNRSGQAKDGTRFGGHSMVVDPRGRILAELGEEAGTLTATLDPSELRSARSPATFTLRHPRVDVIGADRATVASSLASESRPAE